MLGALLPGLFPPRLESPRFLDLGPLPIAPMTIHQMLKLLHPGARAIYAWTYKLAISTSGGFRSWKGQLDHVDEFGVCIKCNRWVMVWVSVQSADADNAEPNRGHQRRTDVMGQSNKITKLEILMCKLLVALLWWRSLSMSGWMLKRWWWVTPSRSRYKLLLDEVLVLKLGEHTRARIST